MCLYIPQRSWNGRRSHSAFSHIEETAMRQDRVCFKGFTNVVHSPSKTNSVPLSVLWANLKVKRYLAGWIFVNLDCVGAKYGIH